MAESIWNELENSISSAKNLAIHSCPSYFSVSFRYLIIFTENCLFWKFFTCFVKFPPFFLLTIFCHMSVKNWNFLSFYYSSFNFILPNIFLVLYKYSRKTTRIYFTRPELYWFFYHLLCSQHFTDCYSMFCTHVVDLFYGRDYWEVFWTLQALETVLLDTGVRKRASINILLEVKLSC